MSTLHRLLVATDFSEPSGLASERAAMLASEHGAELTLLHTIDELALDDMARWLADGSSPARTVREEALARLRGTAAALAQRHGVAVAERLALGHPVQAAQDLAEQLGADLVITGTRGAGFVRGAMVGSTAERIARRSARPVLMVRRTPGSPYQRVLVPVDFSPWSASTLALAAQVAPAAELVLMHAVELPFEGRLRTAGVAEHTIGLYRERARREARERLEALAAAAGLAPHRTGFATPEGADPWMLVVQAEQSQRCELVAIGRQGRSRLEAFLLGSTTRMVMAEGSADVLLATRAAA